MVTDFGFEPNDRGGFIFISYNTEDAHRIAPIVKLLHKNDIPLWYDRGLIAGRETWERQIAEKIDSSDALLMFITKGIFLKSKNSFVHVEYKLAKIFSNKPIYVVLLDQIQLEEIPLDMRVWWLELTSNQCITFCGVETAQQMAKEITRNLQVQFKQLLSIRNKPYSALLDYSVDLVFCVSISCAMEPYSEEVKRACLKFPQALYKELNSRGKNISQIRAKMIAYHNNSVDGDKTMLVTDFFDLEKQWSEFDSCVKSIEFSKSGAWREETNALEALAYAIRSEWCVRNGRKRQVIVLWTNGPISPLGLHKKEKGYPKEMADDMTQLQEWWSEMDRSGKRLIIFAPAEPSDVLHQLSEWDRSIVLPVSLTTIDGERYCDISRMIAASI